MMGERDIVADSVLGWAAGPVPDSLAKQTAAWDAEAWMWARRVVLIHGIAPLLAERLAGRPAWAELDPGMAAYLNEQRLLNGQRVRLMLADLGEILHAATAAGVDLLPLKGAALVAGYYADLALRPMADLDLLVRASDEPTLGAVLAKLGYWLEAATPRHRAYTRGDGRIAMDSGEHPNNPRGVELHTVAEERLRGMRYVVTDALWDAPRSANYAGVAGLIPAPGALLQHILIHTSHNLFNCRLRLIQLHDIALLAAALGQHDWNAVLEAANAAGEARLLYAPLRLAERVYGQLAPPAALAELAVGTPAALRTRVEHMRLSEVSLCNNREVGLAHRLCWYHSGADQGRALIYSLLPAPGELRQLYPQLGRSLPLAYVRHLGHTGAWAVRRALRISRTAARRT